VDGRAYEGSISIDLRRPDALRVTNNVWSDGRTLVFDGSALYSDWGNPRGRKYVRTMPNAKLENVLGSRPARVGFLEDELAAVLRADFVELCHKQMDAAGSLA